MSKFGDKLPSYVHVPLCSHFRLSIGRQSGPPISLPGDLVSESASTDMITTDAFIDFLSSKLGASEVSTHLSRGCE